MTTEPAALYRLMTWLSPAYPVGAFSYSHGIEQAVDDGLVRDRATLADWIATIVGQGAGRVDAALFAAAWRAAVDFAHLAQIAELGRAWRGTAETALESAAQGNAFVAATLAAWPPPTLSQTSAALGRDVPVAVAVGAFAAAHSVALRPALVAYMHAFSANLVSAGVRLIPLGQTDGQRVIADLEPTVLAAAEAGMSDELAELGTAAVIVDWCSMRHETQYTRLFRS